jgi:MFS transporter, PPP family, 3-phenylpropionic acid transporter
MLTPQMPSAPTSLPKAVYALYFAALACLVPFMTLYYQEQGLTGGQIGILAGIIPLITLGSSPFWGGIADATRRHRGVLLLTIAGLWLSVLALYFADGFPAMLAAVIGYAVFIGPIVPIIDNAVLKILGEQKADYGRVRLWGSVGWGLAAVALGPILERAGLAWAFYGCLILMAIAFAVSSRLPVAIDSVRQSYSFGLNLLLRNGRFLLLLFVALVFGIGLGVLLSYQFIYIAELGGSRTLMSLSLAISTFSEIPFWFISSWMLRRMGVSKMIVLALGAAALRMFALAAMQAPWPLLPISLLHGPTFAVIWSAGVAEADNAAPEGLGATAQGLFSAASTGLGAALGGFIGGPAYEAIGFVQLFTLLGWMTVTTMLIYAGFRLVPRWLRRATTAPVRPE